MLLDHPYIITIYVLAFILIIYFIMSSEIRYNIMVPEIYSSVVKKFGNSDNSFWAMKGSSMNGFRVGLIVVEIHSGFLVLHVGGRARVIYKHELDKSNLTEKFLQLSVKGVKLKVGLYRRQYLMLKAFMGFQD